MRWRIVSHCEISYKENQMRMILTGLAAAIAILAVDVSAASAQPGGTRNPFCIRDGVAGGGTWDCSYHTLAQCRASASGAGGWCTANPWYDGRRGSRR
jgi:hypothetical protein